MVAFVRSNVIVRNDRQNAPQQPAHACVAAFKIERCLLGSGRG